MKLTVPISNLQKKLTLVNHAISTRSQLPILLNILLETDNGSLRLSGTDLEIGIQTSIKATIEEEGGVTIPARTFTELVSSLTEEMVTLQTINSTLEVTTKKTKSMFQTIAKEEFPKLYEEKGDRMATLSAKDIRSDFTAVIFAASTDTSRPALSGVLVKQENDGFLLVATDGYRLSLKHSKTKQEGKGTEEIAMIVPARVFREIISAKDEGEKIEIFISREKNQILFQISETELIGRLIEAEFPNYQKIIPTDFSLQTIFDREELLKAVKICSIFARESANIIKLSLKEKGIIVSSQTPSLGENTVEIDAKLTGEENDIAFNARYLLDALSNIEAEELTFEMTGPLNPGVFKVKDDPTFLHLIMPIRTQQ